MVTALGDGVRARHALLLLACLALASCRRCACDSAAPAVSSAAYAPQHFKQGRFSVAQRDGRWWFIAPDGSLFLSQGVNHVGASDFRAPNQNFYNPVPEQFSGDRAAWAKSALSRLSDWGFNTVGAWSDEALYGKRHPYTYILYAAGYDHPLDHVFEPGFQQIAAQNTEKARAFKDDPYLIGYFLDNELPWWGDFGWRVAGQKSLLERYARAPAGSAGKAPLRAFLEGRYAKDLARFNRSYLTALTSFAQLEQPLELSAQGRLAREDASEFSGVVAERYFSVTTSALRERDASHLQLCMRFAGEVPWPVVAVAAKYCDVISVNQYQRSGNVNLSLLNDFYAKAQKPLLLTEYSFSATENQSGDPNTKAAMVTVATQAERAEHTTRYARQALGLPYLVGMHWFEWADQSPQGRFDGEDQNYGLVDIHDRTYALLTDAHRSVNREAQATHARSSRAYPSQFVGDRAATLRPAQPPRTLSAPLPYYEAGQAVRVTDWADNANGGNAKPITQPEAVLVQYASGTGWGAGVSFLPASSPFNASGAEHLELTLQIPVGQRVQVLLNEAGAAAPGQPSYSGSAGSDGESYEFPALTGTGKLETYVVDLRELECRSSWGNQHGKRQLDLQALVTLDLYLPGRQGTGEVRVTALRFAR